MREYLYNLHLEVEYANEEVKQAEIALAMEHARPQPDAHRLVELRRELARRRAYSARVQADYTLALTVIA